MYVLLGCGTVDDSLLPPGEPDGGGGTGAVTSTGGIVGAGAIGGGGGVGGTGATAGGGGMDGGGGQPVVDRCSAEGPDGEAPICNRPHAEATCYEGHCYVVDCDPDYRDCNLDPDDGCEAGPDDPKNCGACGRDCNRPGTVVECNAGSCSYLGCLEGFADCDDDPTSGCEVDVTTAQHCGACGNACPNPPMAAPACVDGACGVGECGQGFGDCDGAPGNGCEQRLDEDAHCGGCDLACTPANATGTCEAGTCVVQDCQPGFHDCNGSGADGCESDLLDADNCGACGVACDLPGTLTYACDAGSCQVDHSCPGGGDDCTPDAPEAGCQPGYADCNGDPADGCEVELGGVAHCAACGDDCRAPGTTAACNQGSCEVVSCDPGYAQCQAGGACIPVLDDVANCGDCDVTCDAGKACTGGVCSDPCPAGYADCNDDAMDGCEALLATTEDCGGCGITCGPYDHGAGDCADRGPMVGYRCAIGSCEPGYLDCDGTVGNGCEVDGTGVANCGICANDCRQRPGVAEAGCGPGGCEVVSCDPGRADCNSDPADGCERNLGVPTSCGACGNDCTALPHTRSQGCNGGVCDFSCQDGYADCNGDPTDGCEIALGTLTDCGGCGNDCSALAHVAGAQCVDAACADITCEADYEDCDGLAFTGCEQSVREPQNCGGCGDLCAPAGATSSDCDDGSCHFACDGPLKDCNGDPADGCEADIQTDVDHCGGCGITCNGVCNDGVCGCETDDHCGVGESCCDGLCVFTNSTCVWWPCIPGFTMPRDNCGGCGMTCGQLACCRN